MDPLVVIIVVNWNGWQDTILCLQSLFQLRDAMYRVIVCDNHSSDGSLGYIRAWAAGALDAYAPPFHPARDLCIPPPARPILVAEYEAERLVSSPEDADRANLVLVQTGANLGFAGGNNCGIRLAIDRGDAGFVWLVNNDTVVHPDALRSLLSAVSSDAGRVVASSRICLMSDPARVWFEGGTYNPISATASHVSTRHFGESSHAFLTGCSLLIGKPVWERIGLLDDSFFMYGEDVDYSIRAARAGIPLRVIPQSLVLHAVGSSSLLQSPSAYRNYVSSIVRVMLRHFGRIYAIPITLYHFTRMALLLVVKRRGRAAMRGYLQGLTDGLRRGGREDGRGRPL